MFIYKNNMHVNVQEIFTVVETNDLLTAWIIIGIIKIWFYIPNQQRLHLISEREEFF